MPKSYTDDIEKQLERCDKQPVVDFQWTERNLPEILCVLPEHSTD